MFFSKSFFAAAVLATVLSVASAGSPHTQAVKGQVGAIQNEKDFCLFLPPMKGGDIAANEDRAVAFCTTAKVAPPKAGILPKGFIKSAHLVKTNNYIQITGRIDRTKYSLKRTDGGGQYDMKAPVGARCQGYNYFVELIEPDTNIYCIRCCKNKLDCPVNKSTYGCKKVLGGNYA